MTMITPSYLGETIEYSSLHACRSTLEDPTSAKFGLPAGGDSAHGIEDIVAVFVQDAGRPVAPARCGQTSAGDLADDADEQRHVMATAMCPVLVAGPRPHPKPSHIVVIEAPCPDCVQTRQATLGRTWWGARHSGAAPLAPEPPVLVPERAAVRRARLGGPPDRRVKAPALRPLSPAIVSMRVGPPRATAARASLRHVPSAMTRRTGALRRATGTCAPPTSEPRSATDECRQPSLGFERDLVLDRRASLGASEEVDGASVARRIGSKC